jgi:hypothetical protein
MLISVVQMSRNMAGAVVLMACCLMATLTSASIDYKRVHLVDYVKRSSTTGGGSFIHFLLLSSVTVFILIVHLCDHRQHNSFQLFIPW